MRRALFITAYNRIPYLQETLYSWSSVRGLSDWTVVAMIEPSDVQQQVCEEFELFGAAAGLENFKVVVNQYRYGVLHHPWVGFEALFENHDFVVRAEDDLTVSDDILEYFEYASETYRDDPEVATVLAYTEEDGHPTAVRKEARFSPWVWGTWADRWREYISPTWDHDYSTFNGHPGHQSGWDWNLDTRILPRLGKVSVTPLASRVNNIGMHGTHGTEANFRTSPSFVRYRQKEDFRKGR